MGGTWLVAGRRWLDPADPNDRAALDVSYTNLRLLFPTFIAACPIQRFFKALSDVSGSWRRRLSQAGAAPLFASGCNSHEHAFTFDQHGGAGAGPIADSEPAHHARHGRAPIAFGLAELPAATTSPHAAQAIPIPSPTMAPGYDSDDDLLRSLESDCFVPGLDCAMEES